MHDLDRHIPVDRCLARPPYLAPGAGPQRLDQLVAPNVTIAGGEGAQLGVVAHDAGLELGELWRRAESELVGE